MEITSKTEIIINLFLVNILKTDLTQILKMDLIFVSGPKYAGSFKSLSDKFEI